MLRSVTTTVLDKGVMMAYSLLNRLVLSGRAARVSASI